MSISEKRAPIKQTVGAQYICFAKPSENGSSDFSGIYEEMIEKSKTVKSVKISEQAESDIVRASGEPYKTNTLITGIEISVEVIAFVSSTLARMRSETVCTNGLVQSGKGSNRPYFAYGKVVLLDDGNYQYEWYPKCQLITNTADINTSEEKFSEQNDTITISAYPFDGKGMFFNYVNSTVKVVKDLTEDKFFAKPILTADDLDAAVAPTSPVSNAKAGV